MPQVVERGVGQEPGGGQGGLPDFAVVVVAAEQRASAGSSHYATGFDELVRFFRGLAADWRGWPGERTYESLEHELRLVAIHDGHVRIAVQLRQSSLPDGWSASGEFRVDPGVELTRAAESVTGLLSGER